MSFGNIEFHSHLQIIGTFQLVSICLEDVQVTSLGAEIFSRDRRKRFTRNNNVTSRTACPLLIRINVFQRDDVPILLSNGPFLIVIRNRDRRRLIVRWR